MSFISRIENAVKGYARHQAELNQIGQDVLNKYCGKESHPDCSSLNYISELSQAVQENPNDTHDTAFMLSNTRDDVFILNCYRYNDPIGKQCIDNGKNTMSCDLGKIVKDTYTEGAVPFFDCGVESKSSHIDWQKYDCCVNGFVKFEDSNLEKKIGELKDESKISCEDAADDSTLWLSGSDYTISNLSGIECFVNLSTFGCSSNYQLQDITPLAGLIYLTYLDLGFCNIDDITPLKGLTNLEDLHIEFNKINDITPLGELINLEQLVLAYNSISDIWPLGELINLSGLYLYANKISDILPLTQNLGLGVGDGVYLDDNPLSLQSIDEYIPALQARGVEVSY